MFKILIRKQDEAYNGPRANNKYDLTHACKRCGSGTLRAGELIISKLPKERGPIFLTLSRDILVGEELANEISRIYPIHDFIVKVKDKVIAGLYELRSQFEFPPFSPITENIDLEDSCPRCNRDGHFDGHSNRQVKVKIYYDVQPPSACCVANSYEIFGNNKLSENPKECYFQKPLTFVNEALKNIIAKSCNYCEFEPLFYLNTK